MAGEKPEDRSKKGSCESADSAPGTTPFFVAFHTGNPSCFYRVYVGAGELYFLHAGHYFPLIDADSIRGDDDRHWLLRSAKLLVAGVILVLSVGLICYLAIAPAAARNAASDSSGMGRTLAGITALIAVAVAVAAPAVLWDITRRGEEMDDLSSNGLRERAERDPKSFRMTADTVSELTMTSLADGERAFNKKEIGCRVSFKHAPTGRWKIETPTTHDTRDAVRALVALVGPDRIDLDVGLLKRFSETVEASLIQADPVAAVPSRGGSKLAAALLASTIAPDEDDDGPEESDATSKSGTFSMNGVGTMTCPVRGELRWAAHQSDYDAVLALCFIYFPFVPYRVVHASNSRPSQDNSLSSVYQSIPLRWSWDALTSLYVRRGMFFAMLAGVGAGLVAWTGGIGAIQVLGAPTTTADPNLIWWYGAVRILFGVAAAMLLVLPLVARALVAMKDSRHRDIRLVLGRHPLGSSDPFYWTSASLRLVRELSEIFSTPTFAEAVPKLLAAGQPVQAMYAARLSAALEHRRTGQRLTDTVLKDEKVESALKNTRSDPASRDDAFLGFDWDGGQLFPS